MRSKRYKKLPEKTENLNSEFIKKLLPTIKKNCTAPQAAGNIHSDFERGFIKADTFHYTELIENGSEKALKELGLIRQEGKDYIVKDGDCIFFKFNV